MQPERITQSWGDAALLLQSIAEQLKLPLTVIARQAELSREHDSPSLIDANIVSAEVRTALNLVDGYLLGLTIMNGQGHLPLEPVSISSTLIEVAHELDSFTKQHDVSLDLHIGGKYGPVIANRAGLKAALLSLGYALVEGYPLANKKLTLAVHRTPQGIVTGLYGNYERLHAEHWRNARALQGRAHQPVGVLASGSGAGLFVADTLLQAMESCLRVGRYRGQKGMVMTLQGSQQLSIV